MKLSIGLDAIEAKSITRKLSEKQKEAIKEAITMKVPVAINPCHRVNGKHYSLALITDHVGGADKDVVTFEPIACRSFQVVNARTKEIRQLTVDLYERGQFSFDPLGSRETTYKLSGEGCDPEMKPEPEMLLRKLIQSEPGNPVVRRAVEKLALVFNPARR